MFKLSFFIFQCYRKILELDPENIQGLHNLCVVHVERGKLIQAQACLEKAHELAPGEDYVLRHLQIVKNRITKLKINPNDEQAPDGEYEGSAKSKVVSNKSIDETERKTQPVVSGDSEEQRYSSRVVNTEPMFVKNIDNINYADDSFEENVDDYTSNLNEASLSNFSKTRYTTARAGSDNDDPSSGMS